MIHVSNGEERVLWPIV